MSSLLFWNSRGACGRSLFQNIKVVCNSSKPCFLFLSETKSENEANFFCLRALGYDGSAFMPSSGRSGGLMAVWKKDQIDVVVLRKEKQFLHFQCSFPRKDVFFFTAVYVLPRPALKQILWQDILALSSYIHGPWVLAGDFNDISSSDERTGGVGVNVSRINLFHHRLSSCQLSDLGYHGPKFT
ncbi:hypothetical protein K1719_026147 [Acacia pycnantha]|nr:hypothetical protein K1719_026147 [Acacia pycnantha]